MFTFIVAPDGGKPFEVKAGTRDVYVWERTNKGKTVQALTDNTSMVDLYAIAHIASQRQALFTGSLQDFVTTCDIETKDEDDDDQAGPFDQAAQAETSSPSPSPPASPSRRGSKKTTK